MNPRIATLVLGALLSTGITFAQAPDGNQAAPTAPTQSGKERAMNPDKQAQHLGKRLGLSADQVAQLKPILEARQQQMESLRADSSLSAADRRAKAQTIVQDSNAKIEALLNDTQKQQFEQMQAERRAHNHRAQAQPGM